MEQTPKKLSELMCGEAEQLPPPRNKQLYENSDVQAIFEQEVEAGRQPACDNFFNAKSPNLAILHEKPEHRLVIFLKARGHSLAEIADATGFTVPWVSQILRQPWARARLADEINNAGRDELSTIIEGAAKDSMQTLITLRDDEEAPASVRANAAQYLVDRYLGKPKQSIEQKVGNLDELTDEQLTAIARGGKTTTATAN